jgi:hypothetical protein
MILSLLFIEREELGTDKPSFLKLLKDRLWINVPKMEFSMAEQNVRKALEFFLALLVMGATLVRGPSANKLSHFFEYFVSPPELLL